jgi:hypothetical protein
MLPHEILEGCYIDHTAVCLRASYRVTPWHRTRVTSVCDVDHCNHISVAR